MIHHAALRTIGVYLPELGGPSLEGGRSALRCASAINSLLYVRTTRPYTRATRLLSTTSRSSQSSLISTRCGHSRCPATSQSRPGMPMCGGARADNYIWDLGRAFHRTARSPQKRCIVSLARAGWYKSRKPPVTLSRGRLKRSGSSRSGDRGAVKGGHGKTSEGSSATAADGTPPGKGSQPLWAANKHLLNRLPHMGHIHRPTKEELLAAATGFWARQRVRFKWFSIRSLRPFNTDDISAFFSWFLVGHVIWILVGTTTFFSLAILLVNTVFAQETLARWIGNYLTKSSGIKVVFESAIVPKWNDGVISFRNVFVSRRPGQGRSRVSKGSSTTAAAAAAAARSSESGEIRDTAVAPDDEVEDTNYTQFDLTLDTVNVTLSFAKWFNGKGLLRDVEVKGIRGVVDRTSVRPTEGHVDPRSFKHEHNPGDFEIAAFKLEDLLVTVHQPGGFRPFSVSIFACDLPRLRKQWLFYDFLSANTMSGSFDNSLFTIHPRQVHSHMGVLLDGPEELGKPMAWKKHSRFRIDGLNIDHLNRGVQGPFSWIHEGNVDIVADIMLPVDTDESIAKVMSDVYDRVEATVTSSRSVEPRADSAGESNSQPAAAEVATAVHKSQTEDDQRFVIMDLRVHLNNVRAAVPLFTKDLSYAKNAMVRPIVAYINSRNAFIPVNCRIVKAASDFDGSWTIFDSGLMEDLSAETYEAFARDIADEQARRRRIKKVGIWSLQMAVQALFMGLATNVAAL